MRTLPDMVARWLPTSFVPLGTDGFGRSDTREALRAFFEIDPPQIAAATVAELARCGAMPERRAAKAIRDLGIDPEKVDPRLT
jgi:pyruvate dehydrogenase E1 component